MLLLPKRHVHSELDFTDDEAWDFIGINRDLIQAYKKMFDSAFVLTRENTPGQTQWHWHRHFMPHEKTVIPEAPRVPFVAILKELL